MTRYAAVSDLASLGIVAASVGGVSTAAKEAALDSASSLADGYLSRQYTLPLTAWADALKECVCCIAAETILNVAGHNPAAGRDDITSVRADRWRAWLASVADGRVSLAVTDATPADASDDGHTVVATYTAKRNWSRGR